MERRNDIELSSREDLIKYITSFGVFSADDLKNESLIQLKEHAKHLFKDSKALKQNG